MVTISDEDPHLMIGRAVDKVLYDLQATFGDRVPEVVLRHAAASAAVSAIEHRAYNRAAFWLEGKEPYELEGLAQHLNAAADSRTSHGIVNLDAAGSERRHEVPDEPDGPERDQGRQWFRRFRR